MPDMIIKDSGTNRLKPALATVLLAVLLKLCLTPVTFAEAEEKPGVVVAVIDSGIARDNPAVDYSRIMPGQSYVDGETSYTDKIGHGTAIAAIIQAYAPDAVLAPLMFYTAYASGVPRNGGIPAVCAAIHDAVDNYQCKIINISAGITSENTELKAAVDYAESKNVIIVSAVGNDNKTDSSKVFYPAAYATAIGVGAVDAGDTVADFSQRNLSVKTVMYGVDIAVPSIKNSASHTTVSGTSYAAAAICGIAAGIAAEYPAITPADVRKLIRLSCRDLGDPGYDTAYGYGVPDMGLLSENLQLLKEGKLMGYRDVEKESPYYHAIEFVSAKGIMTGISELDFGPGIILSNAMLAAILYRIEGEAAVEAQQPGQSQSVMAKMWYDGAMAWAAGAGITSGTEIAAGDLASEAAAFPPDQPVSEKHLAAVLSAYVKFKEASLLKGDSDGLSEDDPNNASICISAITEWLAVEPAVGREDAAVEAADFVTRAEIASILAGLRQ